MKVRYIGPDLVALEKGREYNVISIEKGWYRIMTELDEDYLVPPEMFEIVGDPSFHRAFRNLSMCTDGGRAKNE
ncbi:MAG: hypothetical protein PUC47_13130 [Oscillospiraceae bacterium]|nr:hypothetical protein [Oscillospiraceae bacterium]